MTVYMYAYNVLLTNTCNMYEIKILLLLLLLLTLLSMYSVTAEKCRPEPGVEPRVTR